VAVEVHDPHASNEEINHEYGFELIPEITGKFDAVIVAVNHSDYLSLEEEYFDNLLKENGVLVDVKGIYRNKHEQINYLSL
jgi:UDP-N-acetyl-D-galactosamine dehydrogenase